jgi:hypothetical protein
MRYAWLFYSDSDVCKHGATRFEDAEAVMKGRDAEVTLVENSHKIDFNIQVTCSCPSPPLSGY